MTLTYVEPSEAVVDADPVRALLAAQRDGLLRYHGYASGDRYEVEVAGRRMFLPEASVAEFVGRLRAVEQLAEVGVDAQLTSLREDDTHIVRVDGRLIELPADRVVDWCAGYAAGMVGQGRDHVGEDRIGEIATLFEQPTRDDQCRMVILGLMHRTDPRMSMEELSELVGKAKKTVVDALGFGPDSYLASDMAEAMIRAFGLRWAVTAGPGQCVRAQDGEPADPLPEMPGLVALRRILAASRSGWLRYVDEPSPNKARWKPERERRYQVTVGDRGYVISADGLDAWLDGLAAFHAARD